MRRFLPFAALLGVALVLGCQDVGTAPTAPQFSHLPARAISADGEVASVNSSGRHGLIERLDDGSHSLINFNTGGEPFEVGDPVFFTLASANSRHASDIVRGCPPNCSGG